MSGEEWVGALSDPGVRQVADQLRDRLREHADTCCCDQWVTHHSQVLATEFAALLAERDDLAAKVAAVRELAADLTATPSYESDEGYEAGNVAALRRIGGVIRRALGDPT